MKAQVLTTYDESLTADRWVAMQNVPDPKITKSTDVIVRIGGAGVCRTDLHIIEGVWKPHMDPNGDSLLPLIMGHENAGWVEEVGKEVEGIKAMAEIAAADIAIRKRTEKLRALRLAKEAADAAQPPEPKAKSRAKTKDAKKGLT